MALVKAPLTWPKSCDSSRSTGIEPVLTGMKALSARVRSRMNGLGDEFLARAAFAGDQHGRARRRHLRDQIEHGQHFFALADDVGEVVALLQRALELDVFFAQAAAFDGQRHLRDAARRSTRAW